MDHKNTVRPQLQFSTSFDYDSGSPILAYGGYQTPLGPREHSKLKKVFPARHWYTSVSQNLSKPETNERLCAFSTNTALTIFCAPTAWQKVWKALLRRSFSSHVQSPKACIVGVTRETSAITSVSTFEHLADSASRPSGCHVIVKYMILKSKSSGAS
jgi:hypothetical protein